MFFVEQRLWNTISACDALSHYQNCPCLAGTVTDVLALMQSVWVPGKNMWFRNNEAYFETLKPPKLPRFQVDRLFTCFILASNCSTCERLLALTPKSSERVTLVTEPIPIHTQHYRLTGNNRKPLQVPFWDPSPIITLFPIWMPMQPSPEQARLRFPTPMESWFEVQWSRSSNLQYKRCSDMQHYLARYSNLKSKPFKICRSNTLLKFFYRDLNCSVSEIWHKDIWKIVEERSMFHGDWLTSVLLSAYFFHALSLRCQTAKSVPSGEPSARPCTNQLYVGAEKQVAGLTIHFNTSKESL